MGWLSAAGSIVAGLFSPNEGKTVGGELLKDMSSGVDKLFFMDEEKAELSAEMETKRMELQERTHQKWLEMLPALKDSEANRSVTRRILAIGVTFNILLLIWICVFFEWLAYIKETATIPITDNILGQTITIGLTPVTISILRISTVFSLGTVFICIIGFYFGPPLFNALRGNKL